MNKTVILTLAYGNVGIEYDFSESYMFDVFAWMHAAIGEFYLVIIYEITC